MRDDRDGWSEHQPTTEEKNVYITEHGWPAYSRWHVGVDREHDEGTKARYKFPYGDLEKAAHRLHELVEEGD